MKQLQTHPFRIALFVVCLLCIATIAGAQERPRNLIILIGDGMGVAQLSAHQLADENSVFGRFPVAGFSMTQSASHFVTESAAGGTALATGYRTRNDVISLDPDGDTLRTLLEFARASGKAIGVVATSSVTHATPASFLAHATSRKLEFDIAAQIAESGADVIIGGGKKWFLPEGAGGGRSDKRNLLEEMRGRGYAVLTQLRPERHTASRFIWLAADDALPPATQRHLPASMTLRVATEHLKQHPNGFVLMVEGSQIDWAGHDNDFERLRAEMFDFNDAVRTALEFAEADGQTTVVVTADHETGGLALVGGNADGSNITPTWVHKEHTGSMVPILAFGPGSARFGGIHRNDELGRLFFSLIGEYAFAPIER